MDLLSTLIRTLAGPLESFGLSAAAATLAILVLGYLGMTAGILVFLLHRLRRRKGGNDR